MKIEKQMGKWRINLMPTYKKLNLIFFFSPKKVIAQILSRNSKVFKCANLNFTKTISKWQKSTVHTCASDDLPRRKF